jgi:hypothetical protein
MDSGDVLEGAFVNAVMHGCVRSIGHPHSPTQTHLQPKMRILSMRYTMVFMNTVNTDEQDIILISWQRGP